MVLFLEITSIGYHFASHGCLGVLATYRLVPNASFPQGAEDMAGIVAWLVHNAHRWGGDPSRIYLIGQSAGGGHLATALFTGLLRDWKDNIGGIVLQSAPLWYNLKLEKRRQIMLQYHQTDLPQDVEVKTALSLFQKCSKEEVELWPRLLLMLAEFDPDETVDGNLRFLDAFRKKMNRLPVLEVMKGHNHVSYVLGVGLAGHTIGARLLAFVHGE